MRGVSHARLVLLRHLASNTAGEPLGRMLRRGSAGINTPADHLALLDATRRAPAAVQTEADRHL
jgi:hypothetical protein